MPDKFATLIQEILKHATNLRLSKYENMAQEVVVPLATMGKVVWSVSRNCYIFETVYVEQWSYNQNGGTVSGGPAYRNEILADGVHSDE